MIERAISFGDKGSLVGVLTEHDPARAVAGAPAVLMWNVGVNHRIGPYRIQVDIARELSRRGFMSLRFDVSGMGDSEVRQDSRSDHERTLNDIRDAMALLERRYGIKTFVPIGFCSSVDAAHSLSLTEDRIVGACFIEGYSYRTRGFWLRYPRRLLNVERWKRRMEGRKFEAGGSVYARQYPSLAQFGDDMRALVKRRSRLLFIYVGGDTDFNHIGQFEEMVGGEPLGDGVEIEYYDGADHTFFRVEDRAKAVQRIGGWMERVWRSRSTGSVVDVGSASAGSIGPQKT